MLKRLHALRARHEILEARISAERGRPRPDAFQLMQLKRIKLKLRDEIARVESETFPDEPLHA